MALKRRFRFCGNALLLLAALKVAMVSKPPMLYVSSEFAAVGRVVASQNKLVMTAVKAAADFYLTADSGRVIGKEPLALCLNDKDDFDLIPILDKPVFQKSLKVNGLLPYETDYSVFREIRLEKRAQGILEKIWQGSRFLTMEKIYKNIQFELKPIVTVLTGDIMLGRKVGTLIDEQGIDYPFLKVIPRLQAADLCYANLETPLCVTGEFINLFRAHPKMAAGLKLAGFDVVGLANNHVLDYHQECMMETWEHLSRVGLKQIGSGMNLIEAREGAIFEIKNKRIGFLAYTDTWFLYSRKGINWVAGEYPGVAPMDKDLIIADIKRLKKAQVDLVIVSLHWGIEYSPKITKDEKILARALADAGADIVFGHHPHVIKPWEFYKGVPIFYSAGNFIFDPLRPPDTEKGLFIELIYLEGLRDVYVEITSLKDCQVQLTDLPPPEPDAIIK